MDKSRLVAFNVERGLQPGAVVTTVVVDNGGALGRRGGGEEKKENREHHVGKHPVKCGENPPRVTFVQIL